MTIQIPLSVNGKKHAGKYSALVDDEDYDFVSQKKWSALVQNFNGKLYVKAQRFIKPLGKQACIIMHREIWENANGQIPQGMEVDHIEHGEFGALDNRRTNLRLATSGQQKTNSRKRANSSSSFKGVHFSSKHTARPWMCQIQVDGRRRHIGTFASEVDAAIAYDNAARKLFTSFACLNFPGLAS